MTGTRKRETAGPLPITLRFAEAPGRNLAASFAALVRHPLRGLAIAQAWLTGKRVRARQSAAALFGVDHRLDLPSDTRPEPEPASVLGEFGIAVVEAGTPIEADAAMPLVVLAAPGHRLLAGAGAAIAGAFARDPSLQALYGDAILESGPGGRRQPVLRPAFDAEFARGAAYVGLVVAARRASLDDVGADLAPGAESLDLCLRLDARFGAGAVKHLPRFLSWSQLAEGGGPEPAAWLSAVRSDLQSRGWEKSVATADRDGLVWIAHPLPDPLPTVSLIVPTRDRLDLLKPCIESLLDRTDWPDKEILVCDNDSREPETLAFLAELASRGLARTLRWPGPFDFAAMNNHAAREAGGRVLAFINNDVEAFEPDWLERMVREAVRPDVGAVGAKLLDGEGRVQHGGVVLGTGGLVTHAYRHFPGDAPGYLGALRATRSVSAVTAACLVVETDKFRKVGGFDAAHFAIDFNDVDLCLRLNVAGYRTLIVPSAVLHHRESSSRRWTPAARARHEAEVDRLKTRSGPLLAQDPHYHPGFEASLSTHARLRPGWTGKSPAVPR